MRSNVARWRPGHSRDNVFLTPAYVLEAVRSAFGGSIGLDPCTEADNPTGAERFYALPTNGMAESWDAASIWCNPPYGEAKRPWVRRCLEIGQAGRSAVALLVPAQPDTELGQAILKGAEAVVFLAGRLDFGTCRDDGRPWRASHPSMLAVWNVDLAPLRGIGVVMRGSSTVGLGLPA
jgi:DNA N-6-adenine-methyltransferase (Dam)